MGSALPNRLPAPEPGTVAVVVLNFDGLMHLQAGLPAMLGLEGLAGPAAIVVADNGSTDGSIGWLRATHPGVTILEHGENLGFAAGYDRALGQVDAEWALLLNNDTKPMPDVLRRLCDAVSADAVQPDIEQGRAPATESVSEPDSAPDPDTARVSHLAIEASSGGAASSGPLACAGARLIDWDGRRLDFDGGGMAISGHGHALGHGSRPATYSRKTGGPRMGRGSRVGPGSSLAGGQPIAVLEPAPHPTPFCSGAAMLVHVPTFLVLGGFDPGYFAYYEDVDFGWRLWSAGYRAIHVPAAVVRHRGGGSAATLGGGRRERLHERNALMTVIKNAEEPLAQKWIRAALGLAAWRAAGGGMRFAVIDGAAHVLDAVLHDGAPPALAAEKSEDAVPNTAPEMQDLGARAPNTTIFPTPNWSGWRHLEPLALDLEQLAVERERVQALRKRSDAEIIELMRFPWAPVPPTVAGWAALRRAVRVFELEGIFGPLGGDRWGGPSAMAGRLVERLRRVAETRGGLPADNSAHQQGDFPSRRPRSAESGDPVDFPARHLRPAEYGDPVDVVLVNYEGRGLLEACLPALTSQDYPDVRICIADNGSRDGTVAWLRAEWPDVAVLDLGRNLGFAEANNRAIAAGGAPWVALVNTDTLPSEGWLSALVRAADGRPDVGAVASRMLFMDRPEVVQSAGIAVDPSGIAWDRLGGAPAQAAEAQASVFGASAGAALYRRSALEDVADDDNVFDPRFFMYLEDVDLAWRLRLRGWDAAYAPEATILHEGSATSGEGSAFKNRLLARNKVWTVVKCYPARGLALYWPLVLAYDVASIPYRVVIAGQSAALLGRLDALAGLKRALQQRKLIQTGRRAQWPAIRAAMEPIASPVGVLRRYRHLRRSAGVRPRPSGD